MAEEEPKKTRILYVDPDRMPFENAKISLQFGIDGKRVTFEYVRTYREAIKLIKGKVSDILDPKTGITKRIFNNPFDVIFTEQELDKKSAQDLISTIRKNDYTPFETAIVIVAKRLYGRDRVMAVGELMEHTDDYLVKGELTSWEFGDRLLRTISNRQNLSPLLRAMEKWEFRKALILCETLLKKKDFQEGRLLRTVLNQRWRCYLELQEYAKAEESFRNLIKFCQIWTTEHEAITYAQEGLALSLHYLGRHDEAEALLLGLQKRWPNYMDGFNTLSRIYRETDRDHQALWVLKEAVKRSPEQYGRHRDLWVLALDVGDMEAAETAFKVLTTGSAQHSDATTPEVYSHLAEVHIEKWDLDAALESLQSAMDFFKKDPKKPDQDDAVLENEMNFVAATMQSKIYSKKWDEEKSQEAMAKAVNLHVDGKVDLSNLSDRTKLQFAHQCMESGHDEVGEAMIERLAENVGNSSLSKLADKIIKNPEKKATFNAVHEKAKQRKEDLAKQKEREKQEADEKLRRESADDINYVTGLFKTNPEVAIKRMRELLKESSDNRHIRDAASKLEEDFIKWRNAKVAEEERRELETKLKGVTEWFTSNCQGALVQILELVNKSPNNSEILYTAAQLYVWNITRHLLKELETLADPRARSQKKEFIKKQFLDATAWYTRLQEKKIDPSKQKNLDLLYNVTKKKCIENGILLDVPEKKISSIPPSISMDVSKIITQQNPDNLDDLPKDIFL